MKTARNKLLFLALLITLGLVAAYYLKHQAGAKIGESSVRAEAIEYYTCTMHPHVHADGPGNCPICGMKLVPVYKKKKPAEPVAAGVEISAERQQLIGVKLATVQSKVTTLPIRTTGRVAFDPELYTAIREYLSVAGDAGLRQAAATRLRLLSMSDAEIRRLPARRADYDSLALVDGARNIRWIYATIYETELAYVRPGTRAEITGSYGGRATPGIVRALAPVVDPQTRSVRARIELIARAPEDLRPDSYVTVTILANLGERVTIPRDALIDTGGRRLVYLVGTDGRFYQRDVVIGPEAGDEVVVQSGLRPGDRVVAAAAFLIDAESQYQSIARPTNAGNNENQTEGRHAAQE